MRPQCFIGRDEATHQDNFGSGGVSVRPGRHRQPRSIRKNYVAEDNCIGAVCECGECFASVKGRSHGMAVGLEDFDERLKRVRLILNHENRGGLWRDKGRCGVTIRIAHAAVPMAERQVEVDRRACPLSAPMAQS